MKKTILSALLFGALAVGFVVTNVNAEEAPTAMKCGEGKCGTDKGDMKKGSKCGEGKCGDAKEDKKDAAKCGKGKCGDSKKDSK